MAELILHTFSYTPHGIVVKGLYTVQNMRTYQKVIEKMLFLTFGSF